MSLKPVVLIYDINNELVDECAGLIGKTGLYTSINTYNETNAREALKQYDRFFGVGTNRLSCIITGWNDYKKPRDQFLFHLRAQERRSPFRRATPVVLITEDHRIDLKRMALDPTDGFVAAYLSDEAYQSGLSDLMRDIVFENKARELNSVAFAQLPQA